MRWAAEAEVRRGREEARPPGPSRFARWWMRRVGVALPGPVQDALFGSTAPAEGDGDVPAFTLERGHGVLPGSNGQLFCLLCGGAGDVECGRCSGRGTYATRIGGAGAPGVVGAAKCRFCRATGRTPCVVCRPEAEWMPTSDPRAELEALRAAKARKRDKKKAEKRAKEARLRSQGAEDDPSE